MARWADADDNIIMSSLYNLNDIFIKFGQIQICLYNIIIRDAVKNVLADFFR